MNELNIKSDISSFYKNKNFIKWMKKINNLSEKDVLNLSVENYFHGYCEDQALYFAIRYDVDLLFLNNEHNLIKINNRYYDAANTSGVEYLSDLIYVKSSQNLSLLTENQLLKLIKTDNDWKAYKPLLENIYLIEKYNI